MRSHFTRSIPNSAPLAVAALLLAALVFSGCGKKEAPTPPANKVDAAQAQQYRSTYGQGHGGAPGAPGH